MGYRFQQGDRPLQGYTIERGVGRGGFGEVYYARSDGGKEVAIKHLRDNPQVELRGVQHVLNLKSPYLVGVHDVKQNADGEFFIIMEFVNGPSLRELMNDAPNGLGPQKAAYFAREIAKGLAYLHDRGIVHRDVKPGNIFYEDGFVKIGDYGLSKFMAASQHSGQTASVGTVHYMAPEVGSGNYDRTIDVYALGVMLYEMLLGRVPFAGSSMGEVLMKHLTAQPEVDELHPPFPHVIRKALAKDPNERYQTVDELVKDLFAEEDLSRSVASFEPRSLSARAARAAADGKPNRSPDVHAFGTGSSNVGQHMPPHLGQPHAVPPPPPKIAPAPYAVHKSDRRVPFMLGASKDRASKIAQTTMICAGLSLAGGIVLDNVELSVAIFMLTSALVAAVYTAQWLTEFRTESKNNWWPRLAVAALIALPIRKVISEAFQYEHAIPGFAMFLLIIAVNWRGLLRTGKAATGSLWGVFVAGAIGYGLGIAFAPGAMEWALAVIGATSALCVQTLGQLWPTDIPEDEDEDADSVHHSDADNMAAVETLAADGNRMIVAAGVFGAGDRRMPDTAGQNAETVRREPRSPMVRFAWLIATCASLMGMLFCFIAPNLMNFHGEDWNISITLGVVLASVFLFCFCCMIPKYKSGLWRGVIRQALFFGGTAMTSGFGTAMGLYNPRDEEFAFLLFGLIAGGIISIVVWFVPVAAYAPSSRSDDRKNADDERKRTHARHLILAGGLTLGTGLFILLPLLLIAVPEYDWDDVMPAVFVPLAAVGIGLLVAGFVKRAKIVGPNGQELKLELPLRRDILLTTISDVGPILRRFAAIHDYRLREDGDMFWSFRRGDWAAQFWQSNIRTWKTKLNVAAFADSSGGYNLRCVLDIDAGFNSPSRKALRQLMAELDDLESLLVGAVSGVGIERQGGVHV